MADKAKYPTPQVNPEIKTVLGCRGDTANS